MQLQPPVFGGESPTLPAFDPAQLLLPNHSMTEVLLDWGETDPEKLQLAARLDKGTLKHHPAYRLMPGCWIWNGAKIQGYGAIRHRGRVQYIHRLVWLELLGRDLPEGRVVSRWCLNKTCWNPDHLVFGMPDKIANMVAQIAEGGGVPGGYRAVPIAAAYLDAAAELNRQQGAH